jgi:hypothetical protein
MADPLEIEPDQLKKVKAFFQSFIPGGPTPGLYKQFNGVSDLHRILHQDLSLLISHIGDQRSSPRTGTPNATATSRAAAPAPPPPSPGAPPKGPVTNQAPAAGGHSTSDLGIRLNRVLTLLEDGHTYEMSVLSVDMVEHSKLARAYPREMPLVLAAFETLVFDTLEARKGACLDWTPDGGIFAFWDEGSCTAAALAAIELLKGLEVFNYDDVRKPLPANETIRVRIAGSFGPVPFRNPTSRIVSDVINLVKHLESKATDADCLCVTEVFHRRLPPGLAAAFGFRGSFEGARTLQFPQRSQGVGPSDRDIEDLVSGVSEAARKINDQLAELAQESASGEGLGSAMDLLYSSLERYGRFFPTLDERWSPEYFEALTLRTRTLLETEKRTQDLLSRHYTEAEGSRADRLKAILDIAGSRRTGIVLPLARLEAQSERRAKRAQMATSTSELRRETLAAVTRSPIDEELIAAATRLTHADDLGEELAFAELFGRRRSELITFIASEAERPERPALVARLWHVADLVLLEDLHRDARADQSNSSRVFATLLTDRTLGARFQLIQGVLESKEPVTPAALDQVLATAGITEIAGGRELLLRCILVAHDMEWRRQQAASALGLESIWRTIAYPKISVLSLLSACHRFATTEDDDSKKLFFDCVRSRLSRELKEPGPEWQRVEPLLILFFDKFECFVEDSYFERLEDLVGHFRKVADAHGQKMEYFDSLMGRLTKAKMELGNPSAKLPASIHRMPLVVQRHLAREGCHVEHFALHPDWRIAGEVLHHVTLTNIDRLLRYRGINGQLFNQLLRREEFFHKKSAVLGALGHPKCDQAFADRYLPRLDRRELERYANDASSSPLVRMRAKALLLRQR